MARRMILAGLAALLLTRATRTAERWENKPYMEWSMAEVDMVLNASPWIRLSAAGSSHRNIPNGMKGLSGSLPDGNQRTLKTVYFYCIRVLTAAPVREALLRLIALGGTPGAAVALKEMSTSGTDTEWERLREFVGSHPDDVRTKGDDKYIIVAITLRVGTGSSTFDPVPSDWFEMPVPNDAFNVLPSELNRNVFISTDTGGRVSLSRLDTQDQLGAKYYFPRLRPDGSPLITAKDRELRFETRINGKRIRTTFDLKKMVYKGKLET